MGGVERFQHIGDRVVPFGLDAEPLGRAFEIGRLVPERLQQAQHAVGAGRGADQDRAHLPVAQFLGQIVEHPVARRRNILEQLLHQRIVVIRERLQHGEPRFFSRSRFRRPARSFGAVCSL